MLLQFSIKNFKTFKDKVTLSLIASNYDKDTRENENISSNEKFGYRLLKSAVIYGANASGKSKLLEAFSFMRHFVINSSKTTQKGEFINVEPFLLSTETENKPSEFEIIFLFNNELFRYGFEATKEKIVSEWLYHKPKTKEIELFYRDGNEFETHERNFAKGTTVVKEKLVRDNALLVSVAAQFNEKTAITVIDWFESLRIISGLNEDEHYNYTLSRTKDLSFRNKITELLKAADLGIKDVSIKKLDIDLDNEINSINVDELFDEIQNNDELKNKIGLPLSLLKDKKTLKPLFENKQFLKLILGSILENDDYTSHNSQLFTIHKKLTPKGNAIGDVYFSMEYDESFGTKKFFALTGPILDVIENGYTLVVDELDSKLHPNLVCKIVSLFNSKEFNKKNAQLIFNTHDTNLLSSGLFRRDQIWFTNKDKHGEAKLYSLADFKSDEVKKNEPFEDNYIRGKYGAIPYLGFFDNLTTTLSQYENEKQKG